MISFDRVSYWYSGNPHSTLSNISLDIEDSEFLLVIGNSGAGKSTLLRCLNGLVPHFYGGTFQGNVVVNGRNTKDTEPRDLALGVGFVFQDPEAQFVVDTVEDELAFGLENLNLSPLLMRKRVEEVLDQMGIAGLRRRRVSSLSGGEKQRVAIAAVLAMQPKVLVLDEPTSQLDPQAAEDVLVALERLNADLGMTVVLAEHRLERVVQHTDRILYLPGNGAAPLCGPTRDVLAQVELTPPLVTLGKRLGWQPLPLTIKEGRAFASRTPVATPAVEPSVADNHQSNAIEVRGLHFSYNGHEVLHNVDLEVAPGEFLAIMGRNGSGKTTLVKHLIGLLRPKQGKVKVLGNDIKGQDVADIAALVGYVPQDPGALLFADTVSQELEFTLRSRGRPPTTDTALLQALQLEEHAGRYPRDLSAGERQRVALAAILVGGPEIVVLDEPTRGLDYHNKELLVKFLRTMQRRGKTIVLVTHDVELVAGCADRVVLLSEGQVVVDGPTRKVLTESVIFSSQMSKLFGGRFLTVDEVLEAVRNGR